MPNLSTRILGLYIMFLNHYINRIQRALQPSSSNPPPNHEKPPSPPPPPNLLYTPLPPPNHSYLLHIASLHNLLLTYSNPHLPHHPSTLSFLPFTIPPHLSLYTLQSSPLASLLPLLKTTSPSFNTSPFFTSPESSSPLTLYLHQPDPSLFFPSLFQYDLEDSPFPFICLYADAYSSDAPEEGGLFINIYTLQATWNHGPGSPRMSELNWYPLDQILQREVDRWQKEKYVYDPQVYNNIRVGKIWLEEDVNDAVEAWEGLLKVLCVKEEEIGEPISKKVLDGLKMNDFAKAFLGSMRRPKNKKLKVAPGIGVFDEEGILKAYAGEDEQSSKRLNRESYDSDGMKLVPKEVHGIPSLLFPAVEKAKKFVRWDREQIPYPGLLNGMAGLYANGDDLDGDVIRFVSPAGRMDSCQFAGVCPWSPGRFARLSEVLRWWTNLIEEGIWKVGEEGVIESADWFDVHREMYDNSDMLDWNNFNDYEYAEKSEVVQMNDEC